MKVYVEGKSLLKVIVSVLSVHHPHAHIIVQNSRMDFQESELASGFVFENPNAEGLCGCEESFVWKGQGDRDDSDPFGLRKVQPKKKA